MLLYDSSTRPLSLLATRENKPWWHEVIMRQKMEWMKSGKFDGDMPPLILPLQQGKLLAYVLSDTLDRDMAIEGAIICRRMLAVDVVLTVTDGHMPIGDYADIVHQQVLAGTYRHGQMQRMCDNEDACRQKKLTDCMVVSRVSCDGSSVMQVLAYDYEGEGGFQWTPQHNLMPEASNVRVGGYLANSLLRVMMSPPIADDDKRLALGLALGLEPRKLCASLPARRQYLADLGIQFLRKRGYTVHDFCDDPMSVE